MLNRLRRPGYWILLFVGLTFYFYHAYQKREEARRREALFRLYRSYGDAVLGTIGEGNLSAFQSRFGGERSRQPSLEEAALFVTTLHLDRTPRAEWNGWSEQEGNVTLRGKLHLEGNVSYPMDLMLVKRGNGKLVLDRLHVGPKCLELHSEEFPFAREEGRRISKEKGVQKSVIKSRRNQEDKRK